MLRDVKTLPCNRCRYYHTINNKKAQDCMIAYLNFVKYT